MKRPPPFPIFCSRGLVQPTHLQLAPSIPLRRRAMVATNAVIGGILGALSGFAVGTSSLT